MLTLIESGRRSTNPIEKGIIELYAQNSPVLERLPFKDIKGNTYTKRIEDTLSGVGSRALNEDYTDSTSETDQISAVLKMVGGMAKVDRYQIKTQGNGDGILAEEIASKTKAASLYFTKLFLKGDESTTATDFNGLEQLVTGDQVIDCGATSGGDELTLDKLDELIDAIQGEPSILLMNKVMRRKVNNLMRAAGQAFEMVKNDFGKLIPYYGGIPIGVIEVDNTYSDILAFDENDSADDAAQCSSIYAARFDENGLYGIQSCPIIVDDQGWVGNFRQVVFDWYVNMLINHPKSVARLRGISNS